MRRIATGLPGAEDRSSATALRFEVRGKAFAWSWLERPAPNAPRRPRLDVLAVRCAAKQKASLLASNPAALFTDDHYRGFPAVLVRLGKVATKDLSGLLHGAWRCQAPPALVKAAARDAAHGGREDGGPEHAGPEPLDPAGAAR